MLTHPTLDQLHQLGLAGMARAFEELAANPRGGELAPAEWLGLLLDREIAERQDQPASAKVGWPALLARRPAATTTPCCTSGCRGCSPISAWRAAMAGMPGSCAPSVR
jgi:hypothetical protein